MPAEPAQGRFRVDPAHVALAGHFPGDPIVPAVLLLQFVAQMLRNQGLGLVQVERMKFVRPVRPGDDIDITLVPEQGESGSIEIAVAGAPVARGKWQAVPA